MRPPTYGATLVRVDTSAAEAMPGVTVVHDGNFIGFVSPTTEAAAQAASGHQRRTWTGGGSQSGRTLFDNLRRTAERGADG